MQELLAARNIAINEGVGITVHTDGAVEPGRPANSVVVDLTADAPAGVPVDDRAVAADSFGTGDLTVTTGVTVPGDRAEPTEVAGPAGLDAPAGADELDELDDDEDGVDDPVVAGAVDLVLVETDGLPPELAWQERALCAQTDPEAFFPEKGGSTREAKRVCLTCDVRDECLEYALGHDERFGIWGGLSERERRKLKKRAV